MGDEQPSLQPLHDLAGDCLEGGGIGHHFVADAGQLLDERWNPHAGIDQLLPFAHRAIGIDFDNADFGDAVMGGSGAGGFEVDEG